MKRICQARNFQSVRPNKYTPFTQDIKKSKYGTQSQMWAATGMDTRTTFHIQKLILEGHPASEIPWSARRGVGAVLGRTPGCIRTGSGSLGEEKLRFQTCGQSWGVLWPSPEASTEQALICQNCRINRSNAYSQALFWTLLGYLAL